MTALPPGILPREMASGETWYQATVKVKGRVVWIGIWSTPEKALKHQQKTLKCLSQSTPSQTARGASKRKRS